MIRKKGGIKKLQKHGTNKRTWTLLIILLLVFIIIGYFLSSPNRKEYLDYISESPSPTGVKAFYTYLKEEKKSVKRWTDYPENLTSINNSDQTLIMIEPFFIPDSEEMAMYQRFMENGNTILLFSNNPHGMFDLKTDSMYGLEIDEEGQEISHKNRDVFNALTSPTARLQTDDNDEILLYDGLGTIAFKRFFGEGQLIVANSPHWLTNDHILDFDHIPLIASLMNETNSDTIYFDEYLHGIQNAATVFKTYPVWFLLLFIQGAICLILWLWYKGKRFGPIFIPREDTVRFSDEGIKALASWYLKGKLYHDSLVIQADYIKQLLQERWGIPSSKEWSEMTEDFNRSNLGMSETKSQTFLVELTNVLRKKNVSKQEFLLWSKKLDRLRKEVEQG